MSPSLVVAAKEIRDHARDTRSMLSSALMALMGPGVVLLVSLSGRASGPDGAPVLLSMLSIFALVSAFAGAADVAQDCTAGERERHSFLPLLLNPVSRTQVLTGKWIAVTVFGLGAVGLNAVALVAVLSWAAPATLAARGPLILTWIGLGLVPVAAFGAAVNLLAAALCRTTKEAQNALRSLAFVPMLAGMFLVFFPGRLGRLWFLLPIAGQQTMIGLPEGAVAVLPVAILALSTLAAAGLALLGAARVLDRDVILSA